MRWPWQRTLRGMGKDRNAAWGGQADGQSEHQAEDIDRMQKAVTEIVGRGEAVAASLEARLRRNHFGEMAQRIFDGKDPE